jgi:hypothetical protein
MVCKYREGRLSAVGDGSRTEPVSRKLSQQRFGSKCVREFVAGGSRRAPIAGMAALLR